MKPSTYLPTATLLSAGGVMFSGTLSFIRMSSGTCALEEPCPFFLGLPACYTGFGLFAVALTVSLLSWAIDRANVGAIANTIVGTLGFVFAGWMTTRELGNHIAYRLGLPTCAYGAVFFAGLAVTSIIALLHFRDLTPGTPSPAR